MNSVPCGRMPAMFIGDKIAVTTLNGGKIDVVQEKLTVFEYSVADIDESKQWVSFLNPFFQTWMEKNAKIEI